MGLELVPLAEVSPEAVRAFNGRIDAAGDAAIVRLPEREVAGRAERWWMLRDGDAVRGGVMVTPTPGTARGEPLPDLVNLQSPTTEGVADRRHAALAPFLFRALLERHPHAYAVGMGGIDRPLPRLLRALRWTVVEVPFAFRMLRPGRVLGGLPAIRGDRRLRRGAALLRATGLSAVALGVLQRRRRPDRRPVEWQPLSAWGGVADAIWTAVTPELALAADRDASALSRLLPVGARGLHLASVSSAGRPVGWVAVQVTAMRGSPHFGDLTVATLLDGLAAPGAETLAVQAAERMARGAGADLLVTNQAHTAWNGALDAMGYLRRPSNYVAAFSPALAARAGLADPATLARIHLTRADGDGRIHL